MITALHIVPEAVLCRLFILLAHECLCVIEVFHRVGDVIHCNTIVLCVLEVLILLYI